MTFELQKLIPASRRLALLATAFALHACGSPPSSTSTTQAPPARINTGPATVDHAVWRDLGSENNQAISLASMCAGALDGLQAADPSLKDNVALQVPWDIQVSRRGKLQAQCIWTGPNGRSGRVAVDILCSNGDNDRCSRFAYASEGGRRIDPVTIHHQPPPPISNAYPPGRDDLERQRSEQALAWTRDNAPDKLGALRVAFRSVRVGIDVDAKIPVVCGEVSQPGGPWRRFTVFSIGAATFLWRVGPKDKAVGEFCNNIREGLQWYAVPPGALS